MDRKEVEEYVKNSGLSLLNNTDGYYNMLADYLETLNDKEVLICVYLYTVKLFSGLDNKQRKEVIKLLKRTDYTKIK